MNQSAHGKVVTRFAPSPTGHLHIGGARTALFNWAFARRHGGTFILRVEDTDKARSTDAATRGILEDLRWLGILWDEGPAHEPPPEDVKGKQLDPRGVGPFFQSQRDHLYKQYLERLVKIGRAYEDQGAYRFKMPEHDITVHDLVLGDVTIKREELQDFVIAKSDGGPTFHFANVVDDAEMKVTHVLRAQEHLMNTPKHLAMFEAMGIEPPKYAHMPLIFNADGSKMSKRDKAKIARAGAKAQSLPGVEGVDPGAWQLFLDKKSDDSSIAAAVAKRLGLALPEIDVFDFRNSGYLKDVLLNYVALLGWNPGGNVERFDLDYLKREFDLERLGKSNAKFDRAKLLAFNADTIAMMSPDVFAQRWLEHLREFHPEFVKKFTPEQLKKLAGAYQLRAKTLDDPVKAGAFFASADDEVKYDEKAVEKVLRKGGGIAVLEELLPVLERVEPWDLATIHAAVETFTKEKGKPVGDVAQPVRVAVSGGTVSPPIHETLAILGKGATLARVRRCLGMLSPA